MSHLFLLAGSNGAGKSTLYEKIIKPATGLPVVNADEIAKEIALDGDITDAISFEAMQTAERRGDEALGEGRSFVAETVFSHESKVDLVKKAKALGYVVHLHVVVIPVELAVARVSNRVDAGGHDVPVDKIRSRYERLWPLVAQAIERVDEAIIYDNSKASPPLRLIARFESGAGLRVGEWPAWVPVVLDPGEPRG